MEKLRVADRTYKHFVPSGIREMDKLYTYRRSIQKVNLVYINKTDYRKSKNETTKLMYMPWDEKILDCRKKIKKRIFNARVGLYAVV